MLKKSFLMVYFGVYDCYENIKIKFSSTISILKLWHIEIFNCKKKIIVKFNYVLLIVAPLLLLRDTK